MSGEVRQLNVRLPAALVRELRVEAAQMNIRPAEYVRLILERRKELVKQ